MFNTSTLKNGIKIISKTRQDIESITILCLVGAGSRYEDEYTRGLSHFLEHMFFKGGKKFKSAMEVSTAIDSIGGDFNAFTGKEYAGYYVKCATDNFEIACDVLSDMLITARFDQKEIDRERGVIIEELNMYQDTPMYQVSWNFENFILGDQPLGWDSIGKRDVIMGVNTNDFHMYKNSLYVPENTVIAVAGGLEHQDIVKKLNKYFSSLNGNKTRKFEKLKKHVPDCRVHILQKNTEQGHFVLGGKGPYAKHKDAFLFKVLSVLTGGMMSSRMFLNVRESKGLCYYISTATDDFLDVGIISTRVGVDLTRVEEAVESVLIEYKKLREEKVNVNELEKSKNYLKGKMKLRLEDTEEEAHMLGKQLLLYDKILDIHDIEEKINSITVEDINRISNEVFAPENLYISMIGPFEKKKEHLEKIMKNA